MNSYKSLVVIKKKYSLEELLTENFHIGSVIPKSKILIIYEN